MKKIKIRQIVKDAFKVDELKDFQWARVDVEDGHLGTGSIEEVNEKYDDARIILDADSRYSIYMSHDHEEDIQECANDLRQVTRFTKELSEEGKQVSFCLIGTKGRAFFKSYGGKIISATEKLGDDPSIEELLGAVKVLLDSFVEGEVDKIYLASNKFVNTMSQHPAVEQLVPLVREETEQKPLHWDYLYEPDDSREILDGLMSRYIESLVYQGVVENIACEQAAKMVAMKSATDNAGDLIDELKLVYNKTRQAAITQELSEIVAGAAAL